MVKNLQLIKVKLELKGTSEEFSLTITELIIRSPKTEKEWEQYFHFRWGVLRRPLGMSRNEGRDEIEQQSFHQMVTDKKKNIISNPFVFIGIIALISALILSVVSESSKELVKINKELDIMKNVLLCRYLEEYETYKEKLSDPKEVKEIYSKIIKPILYDIDTNLPVDSNFFETKNLKFADLQWKEDKSNGSLYYFFKSYPEKRYLPLFKVLDDSKGYILSVSGKGLWSTLKGFLYVSENLDSIKGISFYAHKETPGLGGEIDKIEIKERYVGKKIDLNNKDIKIAQMVKNPTNSEYHLQYMSGATITSDGLNHFLKRDLDRYKTILKGINK